MNDTTKAGKFLDAINRYAEAYREKLRQEVEAYKEQKIEQATEEGLQDAHELIRREIAQMKAAIITETAQKEESARRELYAVRERMTDSVIDKARDKIAVFTATPEYDQKLIALAKLIKDTVGDDEVTLYLSPKDFSKGSLLSPLLPNAKITEDSDITLGGIRAYAADRGIILDLTYDSKLSYEKSRFISECGLKVV